MDAELMNEIRSFSENVGTIAELDSSQARELISRIAAVYVVDGNKRWWWDSLSRPSKTIEYGDDDGLEIISKNVDGDSTIFFVVTDDEFAPWPIFKGPLDSILELISEQRYFEYILVGVDESWCIFDTHHNSLVVVGDVEKNFLCD